MKTKLLSFFILLLSANFYISCNSKPNDETIQAEVNKNIANTSITATVSEGVVTLTGDCPDENCKSSAETAAKNTKNVKSVVDNINVTAAQETAPVVISNDDVLKNSVDSVLKNYNGVSADVADGVVTLRGNIERPKLQDLIMALNGLHPKKIDNQLVIK